ncbi:hypothetical protein KIN20_019489 [Parelaphostrongylus tenuis]|uniref:Uncharacterized protein n=1 Tax=Parelaphostrongylus tenuis TaxID=148309 RepID=A0AAD5MRM8_PARTN|nr:hypothetical protein KIN20_019489 [Parelaphostrongylus tenuis]
MIGAIQYRIASIDSAPLEVELAKTPHRRLRFIRPNTLHSIEDVISDSFSQPRFGNSRLCLPSLPPNPIISWLEICHRRRRKLHRFARQFSIDNKRI